MYMDVMAPHLPSDFKAMAGEVRTMLDVGKRLTQQLLTFGKERSSDGPIGATDLHAAIENVLPIVRSGIGRGVELELSLLPDGARVCGEASQLEQIVLNLCLNARDAIAGHGEIAIVTREPTPADDIAPDCVVLEVRDSGAGMDEATRSRIFEPFFTTKRGGNGLGLATVYGIVRRCGGSVRAISAPGAGTTMQVALPRAQTS
jgi:signal transduction histidine kinase